jgi:hypothetical protein
MEAASNALRERSCETHTNELNILSCVRGKWTSQLLVLNYSNFNKSQTVSLFQINMLIIELVMKLEGNGPWRPWFPSSKFCFGQKWISFTFNIS